MEGEKIKTNKSLISFISGVTALFVQIIYVKIYFYILSKFIPISVAEENENKYFIYIIAIVSAIFIFVFVYNFLNKLLPKIVNFKITRGDSSIIIFSNNPKYIFPLKSDRVKKKRREHLCRKDSVALKLNSSKVLKLNRSLNDRHR